MLYFVNIAGTEQQVQVTRPNGSPFRIEVADEHGKSGEFEAELLDFRGERVAFRVGGRVVNLAHTADARDRIQIRGRTYQVDVQHSFSKRVSGTEGNTAGAASVVSAPMPGKVIKVSVVPGSEVQAQTPLLVIEAMKMENELLAPRAGKVLEVRVAAGDAVGRGAVLVVLA